jgi:drug/metabolite transporter (DMT)-like permease
MVVVSSACFGTLAILTPLAYRAGAQPLQLLAWRFAFAAALLAAVASARGTGSLKVSGKDVLRFSVLAFAGYGAASICFFFALRFADAPVVAVLLYAYPAFVTLASRVFLGEKVTWGRGVAVAVTFLGCVLVVGLLGGAARVSWQGALLGVGAALGYTTFNMLSFRWLPGRSQFTMMTYTFGVSSLGIAVLTLLTGGTLWPGEWAPEAWWLLIAIVLIPTFAAIALYLQGIRGLGPSQAAVVSALEPLFTIALAWVVLGQALTAVQLVGAGLVLSGVVASEISARVSMPPGTA